MSPINFSCPNCQQNLEAQPEHAGMQVSCPHCQTVMIVPQAAPAEPPAAPSAPRGKYSKAPSTVEHAATSPAMARQIVRKGKKPNYKLYAQLAGAAVAIGAGILFGPQLFQKYQEHKKAADAAEFARTNVPPPPPPELNADQILEKMGAAYKSFPSYSVQGQSTATMDMSQINPMMTTPIQSSGSFSMLLGRPDNYRVEWSREPGMGMKTLKGAAWSAGKGNYVKTGANPIRMKDRKTTLVTTATTSGTLGVYLAGMFFDDPNGLPTAMKDFTKSNDETLNGHKCYVLAGRVARQNMTFWIQKGDFLVAQAKITLGGQLTDADMAGLNATQRKQMEAMSKIKGDVVETYDNIETNKELTAHDFQGSLASNGQPRRQKPADPAMAGRPKREKPQ